MKCSTKKAGIFYEAITKIVVGKSTTIKVEGDEDTGMTYYFHPEVSKKYGKENQVDKMRERKRKEVQEYLDSHKELGIPLSYNWINGPHLDLRTGNYWMTVKMPKATIDAINTADNNKLQAEYIKKTIKEANEEYKRYRGDTEESYNLEEDDSLFSMEITEGFPNLDISKMSFLEYKEYLNKLLEKTQEDYDTYRKTARKGDERTKNIKKYNQIISDLLKTIEEVRVEEFSTVKEAVLSELDYLEEAVENLDVEGIEFNLIMYRLETLSNFYTGKNFRGGALFGDYTSDFLKLADSRLEPDFINKIQAQIGRISGKYQLKETELIKKVASSLPSVTEHLESGQMTAKDIEDLKVYIDTQEDITVLKKLMLGIHSGGGPLGQILGIMWEGRVHYENGLTGGKQARLRRLFNKHTIDPKSFEKHIISDKGIRIPTGRLLHPYSNSYFKTASEIYALLRKFQTSDFKKKRAVYKTYMQTKRSHQEVIDITKLRSFKQKYKNTPFAKEVFTSSEVEMDNYEREIRELLGDNMFELHIKEQEELIEDYIDSVKDVETEEKYIMSSPFYFAKHYNSSYYYLPVVNSINGKNYFPSSYYNVFVPKKQRRDVSSGKITETGYYDKDFQELFKGNSIEENEKFEAWTIYLDLLTEVNKVRRSQGESTSTLELPVVDAIISKEFMKGKNISISKKVGYLLNSLLDSWKKFYFSSNYLKDLNQNQKDSNKVFVNYRNTVKQSADKHYKILMSYPLEKIQQIAEKEGLGYRDISLQLLKIPHEGIKSQLIKSERERLARLISNKRIYSKTSSDHLTTLNALVDITNITKARMATANFANIVKNYVKAKENGAMIKTPEGKFLAQHANANLGEFFDLWIKRNLYGESLALEKKSGWQYRLFSTGKNQNLIKYYSPQEKAFKKILTKSLKDLSDPNLEFEFKYEGSLFKRTKNKDSNMEYIKVNLSTSEHETLKEEEFREIYEEYVKKQINDTGIPITLGSLIQGVLMVQVVKSLAINLKSGFTNRHSGIIQNNLVAASGRLGFGDIELNQARRMLSFYNVQRYIKAIPGIRNLSYFFRERALQLETLDLLAKDYFKLLQDKKNQFARAEEYSQQKFSSVFSLMDFAVNNAENHNQLEIVLAVLTNLEVYDNNGVKHKFIEDGKFSLYYPGTLEVKEEFRNGYRMTLDTEGNEVKDYTDNVRIWENFTEEKGKKNTHLHAFNLITRAIDRTQGNYNDKDIAAVFSSTVGKTAMLFKRYLPEQVNANFGTMDFDLATGLRKYEGRKTLLWKHAPTALTHLTFSVGLSAGFGFILPIPFMIPVIIGGGVITVVLLKMFKKMGKDSIRFNLKEVITTLDYMQEVLLKSVDLPLRILTRGKNREVTITVRGKKIPLSTVDLSKAITNKISPLSYEERRVLSESAQELVERIKYTGIKIGILVSIMALSSLMDGDDDDDEKRTKSLRFFEGFLNFIGNRFNMLSDEIEMYTDPSVFIDETGDFMVLRKLGETRLFMENLTQYFGEDGEFPTLEKALKLPLNGIPIPNQVVDQFLKEGTTLITDSKQYEKDWTDRIGLPPEERNEAIYKNNRKKFKKSLKEDISKELKNEFPEWKKWQREDEAKRIADALMRQGSTFGLESMGRGEYESPETFLDRTGKYDVFTDEEIKEEIDKRIKGCRKRGKWISGSKEYREENGWKKE